MDNQFTRTHTEGAKKERGEVFTPEALVTEMLNKLPREFFTSAAKTILDNSCGNGNFLVKSLEMRLNQGVEHHEAISTLYGIELDQANVIECRQRLAMGSKDPVVWAILNHNIICADALDPQHVGWEKVGYMWDGPSVQSKFFDFGA